MFFIGCSSLNYPCLSYHPTVLLANKIYGGGVGRTWREKASGSHEQGAKGKLNDVLSLTLTSQLCVYIMAAPMFQATTVTCRHAFTPRSTQWHEFKIAAEFWNPLALPASSPNSLVRWKENGPGWPSRCEKSIRRYLIGRGTGSKFSVFFTYPTKHSLKWLTVIVVERVEKERNSYENLLQRGINPCTAGVLQLAYEVVL